MWRNQVESAQITAYVFVKQQFCEWPKVMCRLLRIAYDYGLNRVRLKEISLCLDFIFSIFEVHMNAMRDSAREFEESFIYFFV